METLQIPSEKTKQTDRRAKKVVLRPRTAHTSAMGTSLPGSYLSDLHEAYEHNFRKLTRAVGTPKHAVYKRMETALEDLCRETQKQLGVYINNPCPINAIGDCRDCGGWYHRREIRQPKKHVSIYQRCGKDDKDAKYCRLHGVAIEGFLKGGLL